MRSRAILLLVLMVTALVVASGVAIAATIDCPNRSGNLCVGTNNKDTMTGRNRADDMRGLSGADTLQARGGNDTALGQDGPDTLSGGSGKDTLSGAKGEDRLAGAEGADALNGGAADDTYAFTINNWGNDTITDTTNLDPDTKAGTDTGNFAQFGSTNQFLITNLTINLTSSAGSPEVVGRNVVSTGTVTGTVNWSNNAIDSVYVGSITDDTINGNATANTIVSNIGPDSDDTITAGAGNDWISVLDGAGGDTVDCGEGTDTSFGDAGDALTNC